jgi:hypothetical protein
MRVLLRVAAAPTHCLVDTFLGLLMLKRMHFVCAHGTTSPGAKNVATRLLS